MAGQIEILNAMFKFNECYASFVNLAHRQDRLTHMMGQLVKAGIQAERFEAIKTSDHQWEPTTYGTMMRRTPGAIGCYVSQMEVMKKAYEAGKSAFVMEDDLVFCTDIQKRFEYIEKFINDNEPDFHVIWLGGTFHVGPPYWYTGRNHLLQGRYIGRDAERTKDPRMFRTNAAFSTHAYVVNYKHIPAILEELERQKPTSIGIDYSFIRMQPDLRCFAFVPGCVKQIDNMSDIGTGMTIYSGFSRLNGTIENSLYWWQDRMEDFDPEKFDWKEASKLDINMGVK